MTVENWASALAELAWLVAIKNHTPTENAKLHSPQAFQTVYHQIMLSDCSEMQCLRWTELSLITMQYYATNIQISECNSREKAGTVFKDHFNAEIQKLNIWKKVFEFCRQLPPFGVYRCFSISYAYFFYFLSLAVLLPNGCYCSGMTWYDWF